jgi:hypothetical protein
MEPDAETGAIWKRAWLSPPAAARTVTVMSVSTVWADSALQMSFGMSQNGLSV